MRFGIDLTAAWRARTGMATVAIELTNAMLLAAPGDDFLLFASREPVPGVRARERTTWVVTEHRHEVRLKLAWMPAAEAAANLDAMFYPYWPSPPRRARSAPPAVVFVHDLAFRVRPREVPWQQRLYMGTVMARAVRGAAAVAVPSEATRRDLLAAFRVDATRVHVVPEAPASLPAEPGELPEGVRPGFILAVGTIEPRKNYRRLLDAYRRLRERGPVPELVVVGRPGWAYGDTLERLRRAPGVRVLGHVDDASLRSLYREAAVFAFPSLYEGFGLPLVEAMREGTPALIGREGSLPEVAAGAALEVDATDVGEIAAGLRRLLDEEPLRTRLSAAGRVRAAEFSWDRAADGILQLMRDAAGGCSLGSLGG